VSRGHDITSLLRSKVLIHPEGWFQSATASHILASERMVVVHEAWLLWHTSYMGSVAVFFLMASFLAEQTTLQEAAAIDTVPRLLALCTMVHHRPVVHDPSLTDELFAFHDLLGSDIDRIPYCKEALYVAANVAVAIGSSNGMEGLLVMPAGIIELMAGKCHGVGETDRLCLQLAHASNFSTEGLIVFFMETPVDSSRMGLVLFEEPLLMGGHSMDDGGLSRACSKREGMDLLTCTKGSVDGGVRGVNIISDEAGEFFSSIRLRENEEIVGSGWKFVQVILEVDLPVATRMVFALVFFFFFFF